MNLSGTVIIRVTNSGRRGLDHRAPGHSVGPDRQPGPASWSRRCSRAATVTIKGCSERHFAGEFACSEMNDERDGQDHACAQALIERVRTLLDGMVTKIEADQPLHRRRRSGLLVRHRPPGLQVPHGERGLPRQHGPVRRRPLRRHHRAGHPLQLPQRSSSARWWRRCARWTSRPTTRSARIPGRRDRGAPRDPPLQAGLWPRAFDEVARVHPNKTRAYERAVVSRLSPGLFRNLVFANSR